MKTAARQQDPGSYEGFERDQTFVPRQTRNPEFGARDRRGYVDTAAWSWLVARYRRYWTDRGQPTRSVPFHQHDGLVGWWFPRVWVEESALIDHGRNFPPPPSMTRSLPRRLDPGGGCPKPKEIRSWELPAGSIVSAVDATVIYPDGCRVSWGALRRGERQSEIAA